MVEFGDWFPPAFVGVTFTVMGTLKVIGLRRGVVGGGDKPYGHRLMGFCPTWSRNVNRAVLFVFLAVGLLNLTQLAWLVARR
jgi:hypothetical protein